LYAVETVETVETYHKYLYSIIESFRPRSVESGERGRKNSLFSWLDNRWHAQCTRVMLHLSLGGAMNNEYRHTHELAYDLDDVRQRLDALMGRMPELHAGGWGVPYRQSDSVSDTQDRLAAYRKDLVDRAWDVAWTMAWLDGHIAPIKSINRKHTSYGLKHLAEKYHPGGYITNGVFIAAAIMSGYEYSAKLGGPNVQFSMSQRDIKTLSRNAPPRPMWWA